VSDTVLTAPRRAAIRARHAASLVVWRRSASGVEVLMGVRGGRHRFMPNRLVFPGGAVDRADATAPCAAPLRPEVAALVGKAANPGLVRALAVAAARELEEETGLSLGDPPALDRLDYLCRAVTPPVQPIRFNARFFAVAAEHVTGTLAGSGELEALAWHEVAEALSHDLVNAQRITLEELTAFLALSEPQRRARRSTPVFRNLALRTE
jgi:8-oxo-dGTP pyrophosphatase MutT (NUDIX family)